MTKNIKEFWELVVDVWEKGFYGINIARILTALGIFVAFLILRHLFARVILARIRVWTKKSKTEVDDQLVEALDRPIRFIPVVMGIFFAGEYLRLEGLVQTLGNNLVRSLIVVAIFWALINMVQPLSFLLGHLERIFSTSLVAWLKKAIKVGLILIGAATVLEIWGIQVGPIIAGLGLFGVAVALGAQDLFKNLISGLLILGERRFNPGDWINIDGVVEGTVEAINFRSTLVRRFDKAPVYVPNSKLSDNALTNFSKMTHRRIFWMIAVEYRTTVAQLRRIRDGIEQAVLDNPDFAHPPEVPTFVRVDRFNDSSIDIMLYCFTRTTNWGEWLKIKEGLAYQIKEIVEGAGSSFAFPSRSLYLEKLPADRPEVFVPPKEAAEGGPQGTPGAESAA